MAYAINLDVCSIIFSLDPFSSPYPTPSSHLLGRMENMTRIALKLQEFLVFYTHTCLFVSSI